MILTSDHGEMLGDHNSFGKRTFYEQSSRIPLIVSCPARFGSGRREQLAVLQDVYATVLTVPGRPLPPEGKGMDLLPQCRDNIPGRKAIFAGLGFGNARKYIVRSGTDKYLFFKTAAGKPCLIFPPIGGSGKIWRKPGRLCVPNTGSCWRIIWPKSSCRRPNPGPLLRRR